jgi:shikimate kinase
LGGWDDESHPPFRYVAPVRDGTLWLVGMMGAGKSAVGAVLSARLGLPLVDLDRTIESAAGRSIPELFSSEGEVGFRKREREAIEAVAGQRAVVALGGGAAAQPGVVERLLATGTLVYLRARPETLAARVGADAGRPLLAGLDAEGRLAKLRALLAEREHFYLRAALVVDTDALSEAGAAAEILARLGAGS